MSTTTKDLTAAIRWAGTPVLGHRDDYDELIDAVGDRSIVALGEATHGTHEFYRERARITQRLIEERGFAAVAIEGDWPDAYRVHRYVTGTSSDMTTDEALSGFQRFPSWMWRNADVARFVAWLRVHNQTQDPHGRVGFFGLDLYSLHASVDAVITYLEGVDAAAAERARERYSCFDHAAREGNVYGSQAQFQLDAPCESAVVAQLIELRRLAATGLAASGWVGRDEAFFADRNAKLVVDAEEYYREMFRARVSSWNLRDLHMAETLEALLDHLGATGRARKVVVWEHNSHVGDARATSLGRRGELNVGQLIRQRYGAESVMLVGFTTYEGSVTAADAWGGPAKRMRLRRALPGSVEELFHDVGRPSVVLQTRADPALAEQLRFPRMHRAIGVVYRPKWEMESHYVETHLSDQFDTVIHLDHTSAVVPLETSTSWSDDDAPDTYPTGI